MVVVETRVRARVFLCPKNNFCRYLADCKKCLSLLKQTTKHKAMQTYNASGLKTYVINSVRKPENIYRDTTETYYVSARNLREAIKAGRRECRWSDTRFVNAKLIRK